MKPWNPYAMTFHGQPITGQTPPKLVVYGPPLTAQQGAMLQTAYNAFVGAARVSIVPNPTRQGRLLDGSQYTIECSGASCTCTVWTVAAGDRLPDAFSGILFTPPDGKYMVLSGVVVQWEFAKFTLPGTFPKSLGLYLEGGLVFIPSEASLSLAEFMRATVALGLRIGLF